MDEIRNSNWTLLHVGIPVRDLDESMQRYRALGASFGAEFLIDSSKPAEYLVYGEQPDPVVKTRGVLGTLGTLGIELLQPVQGHTVHRELLDSVGEGVGHVAYRVDDLEAEVSRLEAEGCPVILSITPAGQSRRSTVYVDSRGKLSNLIIEFIQAEQKR